MHIDITPKENQHKVSIILVDEEEWRQIHHTIFSSKAAAALPKDCTSLSQLEDAFLNLEYRQAKHYVLKKLAAQSLPSDVLRKMLTKLLVSPVTIQNILNDCQKVGYLNDQDWLQAFIRQCQSRKMGPQAILMKLKSKGISDQLINGFEHQLRDPLSQQTNISNLLKTRYRKCDLKDFKQKQKVIAALLRKGFELSEIREAISIPNQFISD